jgi:hypothetical protein
MEVLIAGVLLLILLLWAGSRCKETKVQLQDEAISSAVADTLAQSNKEKTEEAASTDILAEALAKKKKEMEAQEAIAKPDSLKNAAPTTVSTTGTSTATPTTPAGPVASKLFVTIDKLKIRTEPGLKSKVLGELPLFSEVYFMEEVTDSIYTLSLGKEIAHEPYIKVKTKRGTIGWVYGAGVNYYKKKREGVLE